MKKFSINRMDSKLFLVVNTDNEVVAYAHSQDFANSLAFSYNQQWNSQFHSDENRYSVEEVNLDAAKFYDLLQGLFETKISATE